MLKCYSCYFNVVHGFLIKITTMISDSYRTYRYYVNNIYTKKVIIYIIYNYTTFTKKVKREFYSTMGGCFWGEISLGNQWLKGVFAKNERGYRLNAIKKRF